ncbi:uncharacterized protein SAPINGB_P000961 [Magnusiomyces paraingens]|uniref:Exonuclease V, mitochondrial n=1 Tax=Magnusiomyces paraingens TaxID=2606893 RepID=A0A5E8B9G8_9ASCO|nr:uncharacterized protein SAPINGB_P000961 [Saprochaete ingens]VVT45928.1 unnamed protein product [Saprochaete ingens]
MRIHRQCKNYSSLRSTFVDANHRILNLQIPKYPHPQGQMPQAFVGVQPAASEITESNQDIPVDEHGQSLAQLIPLEERPRPPRPPRRVYVPLQSFPTMQPEVTNNDKTEFPNAVDSRVFDPNFFKNPSDPELPLTWPEFSARLLWLCESKLDHSSPTNELVSYARKATLQQVFSPSRISVTNMVTQYCELQTMYDTIFQIKGHGDSPRDVEKMLRSLVGYAVANMEEPIPVLTEENDVFAIGKNLLSKFQFYVQNLKINRRLIEARDRGSNVHQLLEENADSESNTVIPIIQEVSTMIEEILAIKLLRMAMKARALARTGRTRELYVFGEYKGIEITGIIDDLQVTEKGIVITDTKTRMGPTLPSWSLQRNAYHQVLIYHRLLTQLVQPDYNFDGLYRAIGANPDMPLPWGTVSLFSSSNTSGGLSEITEVLEHAAISEHAPFDIPDITLRDVEKWVRSALTAAISNKGISDRVQVQYLRQATSSSSLPQEIATVAYRTDPARTEQMLKFAAAYWRGERSPLGAGPGEADAKCGRCSWARVCAWRKSVTAMAV